MISLNLILGKEKLPLVVKRWSFKRFTYYFLSETFSFGESMEEKNEIMC